MVIGPKLAFFMKLCSSSEARNTFLSQQAGLPSDLFSILELKGFPLGSVMNCPEFDLQTVLLDFEYVRDETKKRTKTIRVSKEQQLQFLEEVLDDLNPQERRIFILSGVTDFEKTRFLIFWLSLVRIASNLKKSKSKNTDYPLWWYVKGGFDDRLRDDAEFKVTSGTPPVLILDGLTEKSSNPRIEKFVDLINMFSTSDIFILAAGNNPLTVAGKTLNTSCHGCLYLDEGLIVSL